ncbi:TetR/AcrR family transcriptional regulator [Salinibacterium sp. ZJ77]|uniref:TetR/AcrR family transcriptional regulator n=1 Tax=Salinibacterium sp. ZJ77 TaxID=2708337 RepID=UPI00141E1D29|nr:TetR/AcrR family transcriptional regulator [Salinibacterium sp. ZJ77]
MQRDRYEKILTATLDLIRGQGYEATTIRDVAQAAQVGNGTIYRYFGSRDGLVYVATATWSIELGYTQRSQARDGLSMREKIVASVNAGARAMLAEPNMASAWAAVRQSTDPELVQRLKSSGEYRAVNSFSFADPDDPLREDLDIVMESQTVHGLWKWARGIIDEETFCAELLRTVHLVFDAHENRVVR